LSGIAGFVVHSRFCGCQQHIGRFGQQRYIDIENASLPFDGLADTVLTLTNA